MVKQDYTPKNNKLPARAWKLALEEACFQEDLKDALFLKKDKVKELILNLHENKKEVIKLFAKTNLGLVLVEKLFFFV